MEVNGHNLGGLTSYWGTPKFLYTAFIIKPTVIESFIIKEVLRSYSVYISKEFQRHFLIQERKMDLLVQN